MKFGIIVFPGSNCDHDAYFATKHNAESDATFIWHKETSLPSDIDCVIVPGGFSYGDYLRCGAIARFSPILQDVSRFAANGGYVMGICNGFQILTEAGLLPGALLKNASLHFLCKDVYLKTINNSTAFTSKLNKDAVLRIPIAHDEGNYFAEAEVIKRLEDNNQVVFKYSTKEGEITNDSNPNGSVNSIAGIINEKGNVLGMMPHPERYSDMQLGCNDGLGIFLSLISNLMK
jgi:phosphoribosylformylglycinamidine synthase